MFISKEQREKIKLLNSLLGMKHRSKPFDLNNTEDLIEAVELVTAEFADMVQYWGKVSDVNSNFDESIEHFYPANWISISQSGTTDDEDIDNAIIAINNAEDALRALLDRVEIKCNEIWKYLYTTKKYEVISYFIEEETIGLVDLQLLYKILDNEIIEIVFEMDYDGNIQNSTRNFAKALVERLK